MKLWIDWRLFVRNESQNTEMSKENIRLKILSHSLFLLIHCNVKYTLIAMISHSLFLLLRTR